MKSVNEVAKNSNKLVSRLGVLSYMGLMVLTLATGSNALAADFRLWQQIKVNEKPVELLHLDKFEKGVEKSEAWLTGSAEQAPANFQKFATSFSKEPFQFAEGIKAAMLKSFKDGNIEKFRTSAELEFNKLLAKDFGGHLRRNAFLALVEKILAMDKSQLENEKFLEELFSDPAIRTALGLTEESEPPQPPPPGPTPGPTPPKPDPAQEARIKEALRLAAEAEARAKRLEEILRAKPQPTGEVDDSALDGLKQQICSSVDALKAQQDANRSSLDAQLAGVNELFNKFASASRVGDVARNENKDRLEEILPGLLQNALGQQQQQQPIAPPPPPPSIPPTSGNEARNENGIFDQPLPQRPEPQPEEPLAPLQLPAQGSSGIQQAITLDLPTATGGRELGDAEAALAKVNPETRTSVMATLGQNAGLTELVMGKARVQGELRNAQAALQGAKDRAARLDEQLEELKEGGRAALPSWVKKKETELQAKVDKAQKALESVQAGAQYAKTPDAQAAVQGQFQQLSGQKTVAEEELAKFKAEVETKVQEGNKKIKGLAKRRDDLQSVARNLEGALGGLKEEEAGIQALINNNMQMQLAAIQGGGQMGGTPNVNKISQGIGSRTPRSVVPNRLGATGTNLQSGSQVPSAGTQRGPLGATK